MGHIVNPVGFRVGRSISWPSRWSSFNYGLSLQKVMILLRYFKMVMRKVPVNLFFSHIRFLGNKLFVFIYVPNLLYLRRKRLLYRFLKTAKSYFWYCRPARRLNKYYYKSAKLRKKKYMKSYFRPFHYNFWRRVVKPYWRFKKQILKKNLKRLSPYFFRGYNDVENQSITVKLRKRTKKELSVRKKYIKVFRAPFRRLQVYERKRFDKFLRKKRQKQSFNLYHYNQLQLLKSSNGKGVKKKIQKKKQDFLKREKLRKEAVFSKGFKKSSKKLSGMKNNFRFSAFHTKKEKLRKEPVFLKGFKKPLKKLAIRKNKLTFLIKVLSKTRKNILKKSMKSKLLISKKKNHKKFLGVLPVKKKMLDYIRPKKRRNIKMRWLFKLRFRKSYFKIYKRRKWYLRKHKRFKLKRRSLKYLAYNIYYKYLWYRRFVRNARVFFSKRLVLRLRKERKSRRNRRNYALWKHSIKTFPFFTYFLRSSVRFFIYLRLWKKQFLSKRAWTINQAIVWSKFLRLNKKKRRLFLGVKPRRVWFKRPVHFFRTLSAPMWNFLRINYGKALFPLASLSNNLRSNYYDFFREKSRDYTRRRKLLRKVIKYKAWAYFRYKNHFFFAKRRALYLSLIKATKLPFVYRRSFFLQQVFLGELLRVLKARVTFDLANYLKKTLLVSFVFLYNKKITPQVLSSYFIAKFRKMYLPGEVVGRFFSRIVRARKRMGKYLSGPSFFGVSALMMKASGRFTRKQRAFYKVYKFGPLSLSTVSAPVYYDFKTTPLKFGAVGLKVYLVRDESKKALFYYSEKRSFKSMEKRGAIIR